MKQAVKCEKCGTDLVPIGPPLPPQVANGQMMSAAVMVNATAECSGCGTKYVSQIVNCQFSLGFVAVKEESKIVVPNIVPPGLHRVK